MYGNVSLHGITVVQISKELIETIAGSTVIGSQSFSVPLIEAAAPEITSSNSNQQLSVVFTVDSIGCNLYVENQTLHD